MTDLHLVFGWLVVASAGVLVVLALRARGVPSTYTRDLLHIGAGIWVLGWPLWESFLVPTTIAAAGAMLTGSVPFFVGKSHFARRFSSSVSGGEERYEGLVQYAWAFALLTPVGVALSPFPAAAALLALAWGDGPGGAVGRRWGTHRFQVPGAKPKSLEGSFAVAIGAGAGAWVAATLSGSPFGGGVALALVVFIVAVVAALAEAASPRGLDNLVLPLAVFGAAWGITFLGS